MTSCCGMDEKRAMAAYKRTPDACENQNHHLISGGRTMIAGMRSAILWDFEDRIIFDISWGWRHGYGKVSVWR